MTNAHIYYSQETAKKMKRQQLIDALMYTGLGIGIGSAVALLLAPKTGAATREIISETLDEGYHRGRKATDSALSQLEQEVPNLRKRINEMVDKVTS